MKKTDYECKNKKERLQISTPDEKQNTVDLKNEIYYIKNMNITKKYFPYETSHVRMHFKI